MNLRQLEVFHAVMRTGSVTAAARALNVSQPAVSAGLKHFESQLKMPMFLRVGTRLDPTPEAQALFADVAAIFDRLAAVERLSRDLSGGVRGTLSLSACFPVANGIMARAVASFMTDHPGVRISLYSTSSPIVLEQVANRRVELGVAYGPIVHPEVETERLTRLSIACVMNERHPLAAQKEINVVDLKGYQIITYFNQSPMRSLVDLALSEGGVAPDICSQVSVSLSGMAQARFGSGIALVEPSLLTILDLPGLVARPLTPRIEVSTLVLRHRTAPRSRLMEDFVERLRTLCHEFGETMLAR